MKHLIMGTAGHVDHGKTALIKALTGKECDTHKEEKERGITIHLGFAHLELSNGDKIGIIDVPGHRDFIHTMLSGASGIDFVLLVVAADSGVMPQTKEHLQIMEILGVKQGIVVLTKSDLVDDDLAELCEIDVRELLKGTFLSQAPLIRVSAKTGAGLEKLKHEIELLADKVESRHAEGIFRMYIDRIFSVRGFGTVVTGTVIGGIIKTGDPVYLLGKAPIELRVRRMERHGEEVVEVRAGDRTSLNLVGMEKSDFERGMVLSDRILKETTLIDATLQIYAGRCELGIWSQVVLHTGTYEKQAKIHLINKDRLCSGESGLVQIHLKDSAFLQHGDRFVIRNSSCDLTIGGGEVIDASPLHHRRRPERLINEMELIAKNKLHELVSLEVRKSGKPMTVKEIACNLNVSPDSIRKFIEAKTLRGVNCFETKEGAVLASQICLENLHHGILATVRDYRKRNPLVEKGIDLDELRSILRLEKRPANDEIILSIITNLLEKNKLRERDKTWLLFEDSGSVDPKIARSVLLVENYLKTCGMQTPLINQIKDLADREGIGEKELRNILHHLTTTGKVCKIEDNYIHRSVVDDCRSKLVEKLKQQTEGIKVSDFRDLVNGNRKICLLLLAQFDAEGVTVRKEDFRFLKKNNLL
ncbi:MAG: selenocysteine-specific translation elongation factor [Candidatus Ozemobacteraceae bacterium]